MEQHPVPQNVTTFQFRLIGDMTIKQFGYLAAGAIAAYVSYKLPLPFFFTWPMAIASALLGFGLAFVPIEERPMDIWILSFFKSIYSPTEYVWHKAPPQPQAMPQPPKQAEPTVLQSHPQKNQICPSSPTLLLFPRKTSGNSSMPLWQQPMHQLDVLLLQLQRSL